MNLSLLPVTRWFSDQPGIPGSTDNLAIEEPMEIRVRGRSIAVTMRAPGHDRELAAGFLLTEGLIRQASDVLDILVCRDLPEGQAGNVVDALLAPGVAVDFACLTRHVFNSSSCGLCGKATIDSVARNSPP